MQELAHGIFIEKLYPGVTLAAMTLPRGTILIDAPLRAEDGRSWRAALLNRGSGIDRILINLDAHPDRTIGARTMECPVVAHHKTGMAFRNRPTAFKVQSPEMGAEWELLSDLGSSRWAPPDITFSDNMTFHWGGPAVFLEHHPGPSTGAIWVIVPEVKLIFCGDAVPLDQPPFLADADLPSWISTLEDLLGPDYDDYRIISGRGGLATIGQIEQLRQELLRLNEQINSLWADNAPVESLAPLVQQLLQRHSIPYERSELYEQRLRYGLQRYYTRPSQPPVVEEEEIPFDIPEDL